MKIADNKAVAIHYRVTTEGGELRDASQPNEPLWYLHGHDNIVPGLESALAGQRAGDGLTATLSPDEAYGQHDPELDLKIARTHFPDDMQDQLAPGLLFGGEHPDEPDIEIVYTVVALEGEHVLVTGNHPLAGETLVFEVSIAGVRDATPEEIEHGHTHGPDGHAEH